MQNIPQIKGETRAMLKRLNIFTKKEKINPEIIEANKVMEGEINFILNEMANRETIANHHISRLIKNIDRYIDDIREMKQPVIIGEVEVLQEVAMTYDTEDSKELRLVINHRHLLVDECKRAININCKNILPVLERCREVVLEVK